MLGQAINRFDANFYKNWKKRADRFIQLSEQGLTKIDFQGEEPIEVVEIKALLNKAKQTQDRREFVECIEALKAKFDLLALERDFHDTEINSFIFQERRTFNWLMSALLTENLQYVRAAINPSAKQSERVDLGLLEKLAVKKGTHMMQQELFKNISQKAGRFTSMQVEHMPQTKVPAPTQVPNPTQVQSILSLRLGRDKYKTTQSQIAVSNATEASLYVGEQIHGNAFDFYYTQCAKLYQTLHRAEQLALQDPRSPQEFQKIKEDLLANSGLQMLATAHGKNFLDKWAQDLGFNDAKALHENFMHLEKDEAFETFKNKKNHFMSFANKPEIQQKNDPLEKLKTTLSEEYDYIFPQTKNKKFIQTNNAYATVICYSSMDYRLALETMQKQKNIGEIAGQKYLKDYQTGTLANIAYFLGETLGFKESVDAQIFGNLYKEQRLYERRLTDITKTINLHWQHAIEEHQKKTHHQYYDKRILKTYPEERMNKEYMLLAAQLADEQQKLKMLDSKKDQAAYLKQEAQIEKAKQKLTDYQYAYRFKLNNDIYQMDANGVAGYVNSKNIKIKELTNKHKNEQKKLENLQKQNRKTNRGFRAFTRRLLGRKPKVNKKLNTKILNAQNELNQTTLSINLEQQLLQAATEHQKILKNLNKNNLTDLLADLEKFMAHHHNIHRHLQVAHELSTKDEFPYDDVMNAELMQSKLEHMIDDIVSIIQEKVSSNDFNQSNEGQNIDFLIRFADQIEQVKLALQQPAGMGVTFISDNHQPIIQNLDKVQGEVSRLIQQHQAKQQQQHLERAMQVAQQFIQQANISELGNPFNQFRLQHPALLKEINDENKQQLWQIISNQYQDKINHDPNAYDRKSLEKLLHQFNQEVHFLTQPESTAEDTLLLNLNHQCQQAITNLIQQKFKEIVELPFDQFKERLVDLDVDLIHYHQKVETAKLSLARLEQSYESWVWNPFGWFVDDKAFQLAKADLAASEFQFQQFSQEYQFVLQHFLDSCPKHYPQMQLESLREHQSRLTTQLEAMQSLPIDSSITEQYQQIINESQMAASGHLQLKAEGLRTKVQNLRERQSIVVGAEFKDYKTVVNMIETNENVLKTTLKQIDTIDQKYKSLPESATARQWWQQEKDGLLQALNHIQQEQIDFRNNQYPIFVFFQQIDTRQQTVNVPDNLTTDQLSQALSLAIDWDNMVAIRAILQRAHLINIQDLGQILERAAKQGKMPLVQAILHSREDISFSPSTIKSTISGALINNQFGIAQYILLHTECAISKDFSDHLLQYATTPSTESKISPVKEGYFESWYNQDITTLKQIQKCYHLQERMILNIIQQGNGSNLEKYQPALDQLKKSMLRHYPLKEAHLDQMNQWEQDLINLTTPSTPLTVTVPVPESQLAAVVPEIKSVPQSKPDALLLSQHSSNQFNALKFSILNQLRTKPLNIDTLINDINGLRHATPDTNTALFHQVMSQVLNEAAQNNQLDVIQAVWPLIEASPQKQEMAYSALVEALNNGRVVVADFLMQHQAHERRESHVEALCKKMYQENKHPTVMPDMTQLLLLHMDVTLDQTLQSMIDNIIKDYHVSESDLPGVKYGYSQWLQDHDRPKLNELRKTYLVAHYLTKILLTDNLGFADPFYSHALDDYSSSQFDQAEKQIQLIQSISPKQIDRIQRLVDSYAAKISPDIENKDRLSNHQQQWQQALNQRFEKYKRNEKKDIEIVTEVKNEFLEAQAKRKSPPAVAH